MGLETASRPKRRDRYISKCRLQRRFLYACRTEVSAKCNDVYVYNNHPRQFADHRHRRHRRRRLPTEEQNRCNLHSAYIPHIIVI